MTFHTGEIAVQTRAGVVAEAAQLDGMISPLIHPAAQKLIASQRLAIASSIDADGGVWASLLTGEAGFIAVQDSQNLEINAMPTIGDPLREHLQNNGILGLLIIDLATRRRLRLNGRAEILPDVESDAKVKANAVDSSSSGQIALHTQEVFFNCPKYIQTRYLAIDSAIDSATNIAKSTESIKVQSFNVLTAAQQDWIAASDTFFIASFNPETGADASHRGGYPGFVQALDAHTLLFPDYSGNNMFQTLGNLTVNPKSGLIFVDFDRGNTLQLTGTAAIIWDQKRIAQFAGAQRLVEFHIDRGLETTNSTALRWQFGDYSPVNPAFGKDMTNNQVVCYLPN